MTTYTHDYKIGSTLLGILPLPELTTPVTFPKSFPKFYVKTQTLGDNSERGLGSPTVVWHWDVITDAMRDQLRTFCTGASAAVFIKSRGLDSSDAYVTYSAIMIWPSLSEERDATRRLGFEIEFRELVAQ